MASTDSDVLSNREITEYEIRQKETFITTEMSHTSQSQNTVEDVTTLTASSKPSEDVLKLSRSVSPMVKSVHEETPQVINKTENNTIQNEVRECSNGIEFVEKSETEVAPIATEFQSNIISEGKENVEQSSSIEISTDINKSNSTNEQTELLNCEKIEDNSIINKNDTNINELKSVPEECNLIPNKSLHKTDDSINVEDEKELERNEATNQINDSQSESEKTIEKCHEDKQNDTENNKTNLENCAELTNESVEHNSSENINKEKQVVLRPVLNRSPALYTKPKEVEVSSRNGYHPSEIKEENLKSQLKEIINEIDLEVKKEEEIENGKKHTWHAKGEYVIESTPIEYLEIKPVHVPDVITKELPKEELPPPPKKTEKISTKVEKLKVIERKPSGDSTCSTPTIEIPEGLPLLARILPKEGENDGGRDKIPLERLFTPASDMNELELKKRNGKMFSSSSFYRPDHPTIEDQVQLAHKISFSLVDDINKQSKGQSMYMKRKSKSTKWAHTGQESGMLEGNWQANDSDLLAPKESKEPPPLKLLLNPRGIHDYTSIQDEQYETYATSNQSSIQLSGIGVGKEIVTDLQSPTGKGAALFAKRKKRMNKFIIDETNVQKSINKHEVISAVEETYRPTSSVCNGDMPIINSPSRPGSRNLPNLSNILTEPKTLSKKSILSTSSGNTIKRSNTVSFPSLDRGFPHRTPTPAMRERRAQIKSWGSQKTTGNSFDVSAGIRPQSQKRYSHIEYNSSLNHNSSSNRSLGYGKKQKTNAIYTAEVKVEEKANPLSPLIAMDFNGLDASHYLDLAMDDREKRKSFNCAAKGWGTYNHFYTPIHLGSS